MPLYRVVTSYIVDVPTEDDALHYAPWPQPYINRVIVGSPVRHAQLQPETTTEDSLWDRWLKAKR